MEGLTIIKQRRGSMTERYEDLLHYRRPFLPYMRILYCKPRVALFVRLAGDGMDATGSSGEDLLGYLQRSAREG